MTLPATSHCTQVKVLVTKHSLVSKSYAIRLSSPTKLCFSLFHAILHDPANFAITFHHPVTTNQRLKSQLPTMLPAHTPRNVRWYKEIRRCGIGRRGRDDPQYDPQYDLRLDPMDSSKKKMKAGVNHRRPLRSPTTECVRSSDSGSRAGDKNVPKASAPSSVGTPRVSRSNARRNPAASAPSPAGGRQASTPPLRGGQGYVIVSDSESDSRTSNSMPVPESQHPIATSYLEAHGSHYLEPQYSRSRRSRSHKASPQASPPTNQPNPPSQEMRYIFLGKGIEIEFIEGSRPPSPVPHPTNHPNTKSSTSINEETSLMLQNPKNDEASVQKPRPPNPPTSHPSHSTDQSPTPSTPDEKEATRSVHPSHRSEQEAKQNPSIEACQLLLLLALGAEWERCCLEGWRGGVE